MRRMRLKSGLVVASISVALTAVSITAGFSVPIVFGGGTPAPAPSASASASASASTAPSASASATTAATPAPTVAPTPTVTVAATPTPTVPATTPTPTVAPTPQPTASNPPVIVVDVPPAAPVVEKVKSLTSNTSVVVPVVVNSEIPVVTKEPVSVKEVVKNPAVVLSNTVFDKKPVEPVKNVTVGGIPASKKDEIPFTSVNGNSTKKVEIQVLQDVPVSVFVEKLAPKAVAQVTIIGPTGKAVNLGKFRVASNGDLEIPPLTLETKGLSIKLQITVGGKTRTITVRATK